MYRSRVHLRFKQGKVEHVEVANPAPSDEFLRLKEQARAMTNDWQVNWKVFLNFLLSCGCSMAADEYQVKIPVWKPRDVRQNIKPSYKSYKSFLLMLSFFEGR